MLKWKKLFVSLLSVSVIAGLGVAPVKAAQTVTPYTYKVTLSAGNKGTINGQQKVEEVDLAAGSTVSFDINDIKVSDEKYYVKGIRLSGRDNSEALAAPAFRVNGDADYVVAYGIKGDMVAYTVNYEDEQGNKLAESQTFYGNVGDKPVVAYRYIENYVPQALSLTKTLSDNEAEAIWRMEIDSSRCSFVKVMMNFNLSSDRCCMLDNSFFSSRERSWKMKRNREPLSAS